MIILANIDFLSHPLLTVQGQLHHSDGSNKFYFKIISRISDLENFCQFYCMSSLPSLHSLLSLSNFR